MSTAPNRISVPQWARQQGISKVAAYKRIKRLGITPENGTVDVEQLNAHWEAGRNEDQQRRATTHKEPDAAPPNVEQQEAEQPPAMEPPRRTSGRPPAATHAAPNSLSEAQRAREWLRVKREQMEIQRMERQTVQRSDVRAAFAAIGRMFGHALEAWPVQVAPRLVGKTDIGEIERMLKTEINAMRERVAGEIESRYQEIVAA